MILQKIRGNITTNTVIIRDKVIKEFKRRHIYKRKSICSPSRKLLLPLN